MSATIPASTPPLDETDLTVLRALILTHETATAPLLAVRTGLGKSRVEASLQTLERHRAVFPLGKGRAQTWMATNSHPVSAAGRVLFAARGREIGAVTGALRAAMEVRGRRRKLATFLDVFRVVRFAWLSPVGGAAR